MFNYKSLTAVAAAALIGGGWGPSFLQAATLSTLISFNYSNGAYPKAGLIADAQGNLYGTAISGGASGDGTVFKLNTNTGTLTTLFSFSGSNGSSPQAGLIADADGNLYGTTYVGGANGDGTIFKISNTGALSTLVSFNGNRPSPNAELIADAQGNLYGAMNYGGADGVGAIFKLSNTGALSTVVSFNGINGAGPEAGLIADAEGNLYGTTYGGGASDVGTIFKLSNTGALSTLASFGINGYNSYAGLIADAEGNLYGTTVFGGASGDGAIFKLNPDTGALTTLASFNYYTDGANPYARLIADAEGNLYGTTARGGVSGDGTAFKLDINTGALTTLASFNGGNGYYPQTELIADAQGNLYGTTFSGGANSYGVVFKLTDTGFVVPEPAGLSVLGIGAAAFLLRRRRG